MGNVESGPEGRPDAVTSLKYRLQALEEAVRSIEVANEDAQGNHFPTPGAPDIHLCGARLVCTPGVRVLTGPVIGEVTATSAVVLLEVDIAAGLGPSAEVSCHLSLSRDGFTSGRVVSTTTLSLPSRRPRAFRIGGGISDDLVPGQAYTVCFGGLAVEDARSRVGRFRTPGACFEPRLTVVAVSGDRPDSLTPGEPSLWRVLRDRVLAPAGGARPPIDAVLHIGGQAWMGRAFEDAWELLRRRASEPVLNAEGGWQEAQEAAAERLREAVRCAWNLPDKRNVLSSTANIMLCGAADVHQDFDRGLHNASRLSSNESVFHRGEVLGQGRRFQERESQRTRALDATVRACRRVYCEYQGQLLWKGSSRGGRHGPSADHVSAIFEAEERGAEDALAEARRLDRDVAVKQKKVAIAEEARRRAEEAGRLTAEGGRQAVEDRINAIRKEAKAARARRVAFAKREIPAVVKAAAEGAAQGAFLNLGGSVAFALLDTTWARVSWDGKVCEAGDSSTGSKNDEDQAPTSLLSPASWDMLHVELTRDSELRLLIVVIRFALIGPGVAEGDAAAAPATERGLGASYSGEDGEQAGAEGSAASRFCRWRAGRDHLLDRLFAWKAGEAWRNVVVVCGAESGPGDPEGLRSACELEITDRNHPGCTIRQLIAGPIADNPDLAFDELLSTERPTSGSWTEAETRVGERFAYRLPSSTENSTSGGDGQSKITVLSQHDFRSGTTDEKPRQGWQSETHTHQAHELEAADTTFEEGSGASDNVRNDGRAYGPSGSHLQNPPPLCRGSMANDAAKYAASLSAIGERSYLELALDAGHSPATAIAAGLDPITGATGVQAAVAAEAVRVAFSSATLVLGPVIGRVTQRSVVILAEVGSTAAVGCVLADAVTGREQDRQVRLLYPGEPYAFFFDTLASHRPYTISFEGIENAGSRTGAFTTLQSWSDRRDPPAMRAIKRLSAAAARTGGDQEGPTPPTCSNDDGDLGTIDSGDDRLGHDDDDDRGDEHAVDVRLLFVSRSGVARATANSSRSRGQGDPVRVGGDDGIAAAEEMWSALGRELWRPWPQVDVVVHTGSQVDLNTALAEALPFLAAAEHEQEGSVEREEAEDIAMERIRDAYRFQWSLPGNRAFLSCGSHLMLRGEADLALPPAGGDRTCDRAKINSTRRSPRRTRLSAYVSLTLARLASKAFAEYQRQLWDPLSVPSGMDMNDVGYAPGGTGIDSSRRGDGPRSGCSDESGLYGTQDPGPEYRGEWHFHSFGETVGLFALDVREGDARHQRDEHAPLLSETQWSSLSRALGIEEIVVMIIVGDEPFITESILDARTRPQQALQGNRLRSWTFHGGELLRLLGMLAKWKTAGGVDGESREVVLIGGGRRYPLETLIRDADASTSLSQTVCGPFNENVRPDMIHFEPSGRLSQCLYYCHTNLAHMHVPVSTVVGERRANTAVEHCDPCKHPSCVLVLCEARGEATGARILVRKRILTALAWAESYASAPSPGPSSSVQGGATADDEQASSMISKIGPRRAMPRWALNAMRESLRSASPGTGDDLDLVVKLKVLISEEGPAKALAEAFEDVLDVGADDEAITVSQATRRAGLRAATRRVFDSMMLVYYNFCCTSIRALCPTRPSPVVVECLVSDEASGGYARNGSGTNQAAMYNTEQKEDKTCESSPRSEARPDSDGPTRGRQGDGRWSARDGGRRAAGTRRCPPMSPVPMRYFLPFHDDESFSDFFATVLLCSAHLSRLTS